MVPTMCRTKENKMKRLLILIVLVLAGCGEAVKPSYEEIGVEVNASGALTDEQAEILTMYRFIWLDGLTHVTAVSYTHLTLPTKA